MAAPLFKQTYYLCYRNFLLKSRNPRQASMEIFYPVYFMLILVILSVSFPATRYPVYSAPPATIDRPQLQSYLLAYAPETIQTTNLMNKVSNLTSASGLKGFNTEDDLVHYYLGNPQALWGGVIFDVDSNGQISSTNPSYVLRINGSSLPTTNTTDPSSCRTDNDPSCPPSLYLSSGYLFLQQTINFVIFEEFFGVFPQINVSVQQFIKAPYVTKNVFLSTLSAIYIVIAFSPLVQFLLINIVVEKEKKIKEGMLMMGMKPQAFVLSWFIIYGFFMILTALLLAILSVFGRVTPNANFFLIFLLFFLYGLSIIGMGFMIAPFFDKSKVAGAIGMLGTMIASILYIPLVGLKNPAPAPVLWVCSLISPIALALGMGEAVYLESLGSGATFDTINDSHFAPGFSISSTFIMLAVDTLLYTFLAWYFEEVLPTEYGIRRKPWFLFDPLYWKTRVGLGEEETIKKNPIELKPEREPDVEPLSEEMISKIKIDIVNVSKEFNHKKEKKLALDHVSLQICEDQIYCLLGHNGAGKTTLISILCGMSAPSSGSISTYGLDIGNNMSIIRESLGVCPQQNIIFDQLTVKEHLEIFAGIKGVHKKDMSEKVHEILKGIDLSDQKDTRSSALSGGQKRKLCVGMALIGDPKILFLDEPTAGMDPYSRRKLWDLLQRTKKNRITVLSTHFMDEADILADRKAILSKGKVKCIGSSLFLKNRFGLGYLLDILKDRSGKDEQIIQEIKEFIPEAKVHKNIGAEISFRLPLDSVHRFPELFENMEEKKSMFGIHSYSVSMTTLEEVFLNLENEEMEYEKISDDPLFEANQTKIEPATKRNVMFKDQLHALLISRLKQIKTEPKSYVFSVILPIIMLLIGLIVSKVLPAPSTEPVKVPQTPSYYSYSQVPFANDTNTSLDSFLATLNQPTIERSAQNFYNGFNNSEVRNIWGFLYNELNYTSASFDYLLLYNDTYTRALPIYFHTMMSSTLSDLAKHIDPTSNFQLNATIYPLPYQSFTFNTNAYVSFLFISFGLAFPPLGFAVPLVKERQYQIKHQLYIMGAQTSAYWVSLFLRDMILYSVPIVATLVLVWAFTVEPLINAGFLMLFLYTLFYPPMMVFIVYILSYLFSSYETCESVLPSILNIISMVPYFIVAGLDTAGYREIAEILHYVFVAIDPPYAFFGALHYMSMIYLIAKFQNLTPTVADYFAPSNVVMPTLLMVFGFVFMYFGILYGIDQRRYKKMRKGSEIEFEEESIEGLDSDVLVERKRVEESKEGRNNAIEVIHLTKVFEKVKRFLCFKPKKTRKIVVNDLCFGVESGQCFGLLGPNGAGKTTAISMLTGALFPTRGHAIVNEFEMFKCTRDAYSIMGFCPQFDALFDDLTTKDHLILYCTLKGIHPNQVPERVDAFMKVMGISEYANVLSKRLSGGTKRKLSFTISIIGDPDVIIMDEPSTGMDPASRRRMWFLIRHNIEGKASILTTHSMDEADALCTKIGIMVKGKLECLGTPQHLKEKFGDGYIIDLKTSTKMTQSVKTLIEGEFENAILQEEHYGRLSWKVKLEDHLIAKVFKILEENRSQLEIEEYSFSQTTLEQVFISFAKKQDVDD